MSNGGVHESPLRTEFDPVSRFPFLALVRRELTTQLRTRRLFFGMLTLSIGCAWIVIGRWPYSSPFVWSGLARSAESLFSVFSGLALTGGPIIVSAIAASALVSERERDSWDLLQLSLISRIGIVGGKLLSPFALFGLTLVVCAPIVSALLFLAGLDYIRAGQTMVLILATTFTSGAIALACSVRARKTVTATTIAFFFVAVFMGLDVLGIALVAGLLDEAFDIQLSFLTSEMMAVASPYAVLGSIQQWGEPVWVVLGVHLLIQAVICATAFIFCVRVLGREIELVDENAPRRRFFRVRATNPAPMPRRNRRPIPDRSNPVFLREVYWGSPLSTRRSRRIALLGFLVAFFLSATAAVIGEAQQSSQDRLAILAIAAVLSGAVGCMYVPIACANAYTKELAISNLDLLRGTLLKPHEIVWGKFQAALVLCAVVLAACFLATLPINLSALREEGGFSLLGLCYGSMFASLVEAASAGLLVSFYSKRGGAAIVAAYLLTAMLYFGFFALGILFVETVGWDYSERSSGFRALVVLSPVLTFFWTVIESLDYIEVFPVALWNWSLVVVALFALGVQFWTIGRFHARIEKLGEG